MTRVHISTLRVVNRIGDFSVFLAAFLVSCLTHYHPGIIQGPLFQRIRPESLIALFFIFYISNYISLSMNGVYPTRRLRSFKDMAWMYFKSICISLFLMVPICYLAYPLMTSLSLLLSASSCAFLFMLLKEAGMRKLLMLLRTAGHNLRNVMLVGEDEKLIQEVVNHAENNHWLGIKAVGVVTLKADTREKIASLPNLGNLKDLATLIEERIIDCVIFLNQSSENEHIKESIWHCEQRGVEIWLKVNLLESKICKVAMEHLEHMPFLNFRSGPQNEAALMVKYALDRVLSLVGLIVLSPLFLILAILIKLTSPGSAIYKHERASINGRKFVLYKFRSMVFDADEKKDALGNENEMNGPVFKMTNDPRVTHLGRFLRKTSMDELPQLWNVLKGDMSLVGPRALLCSEVTQIRGWGRRRLSMKPGITCIWQVEGRGKITDFEKWARLDLKYIDEWSLWLDFKLLVKTVPAVFKTTGV